MSWYRSDDGNIRTHVLFQPLKLCQTVMTQIELLQALQFFKIFHFRNSVTLQR